MGDTPESLAREVAERIQLRDFAFFDDTFPLWVDGKTHGPEVCHFTPKHLSILRNVGNVFATENTFDSIKELVGHALQFAYIISPNADIGDKRKTKRWMRANKRINPAKLVESVLAYRKRELSEAMRENEKQGHGKPVKRSALEPLKNESLFIGLVHQFGVHYHWDMRTVMNTPFLVLHSLQRCIFNDAARRANLPTISTADEIEVRALTAMEEAEKGKN